MARVLLTRPEESADILAEKLRAKGHLVFSEPLLTLETIESVFPGEPASLLLTSAKAVSSIAFHKDTLPLLKNKPCYCVGVKTAQAARELGLSVAAVEARSVSLAPFLRESLSGPLLHIRGADISPSMEEVLQTLSYPVWPWVLYRAVPSQALSQALCQKMEEGSLDFALFFSARTALVFARLLEKAGLKACCKSLSAIGISEGVLAPLAALPWREQKASEEPTEESVLEQIDIFYPLP